MDRNIEPVISPDRIWDLAVIGGGATGVGIALDAASRGYSICLLEQSDFGKGTSSRSTKLIHGGVRYLQQGNVALVREAQKERGLLRRNAPHLVHDLPFIVPNYAWWESSFYGIGLKVYDLLAFRRGFGRSRHLSKKIVLERIPTLREDGLRGGILYHDGQFDDSRLLINLAQTATENGAVLLNYAPVEALTHGQSGHVDGLRFVDLESGRQHALRARCIINATGPFSDAVRKLDDRACEPMIAPSQGVHIVLDRRFLPGDAAIMIPRTADGRILFAIPWHQHTLIGTTDTPIAAVLLDPLPTDQEIDFLLETASRFLSSPPTRRDILSVFAGVRPLIHSSHAQSTSSLPRDHVIHVSPSGLLSIAGGKWTTFRKMAQDCVDRAAALAGLEERPCKTESIRIHGWQEDPQPTGDLSVYGSDSALIQGLSEQSRLSEDLPIWAAQVVWAARQEMARSVDDVLSRRTRALFLNAKAAIAMAPAVAQLLAAELNRDQNWQNDQVAQFTALAQNYLPNSN